ncbi:hypothetical protein BH18ACI3_BH18ACI3_14070 [soil metagenome]
MKLFKYGIGMFFAAVFITACSGNTNTNSVVINNTTNTPVSARPTATIDELASGRKVYEINCAVCHKDNGSGGTVEVEGKKLDPDDLTSDKIKKFSDEKIIRYILNGVLDEGMPAFKDKLSEAEIRDVVRYIRTQFHKM